MFIAAARQRGERVRVYRDTVAAAQLPMARFYAEQLLPAASGLVGAATAGSRDLFALDADALGDVVRRTARV